MVLRTGTTLLALLHRLVPGRVACNSGYAFTVCSNGTGGYLIEYPDSGSRYFVETVVELLLAIGEFRALELGWELL